MLLLLLLLPLFLLLLLLPRMKSPERSTTTLGRNIDRTEPNTEPTEPKSSENSRFGFSAFFRPPSVVQS